MRTNRQDLPATKSGTDLLTMLTHAVEEGRAAAAELCSVRLDKLATHAAVEGLSAVEIVELLREEAATICSKGGAAWN